MAGNAISLGSGLSIFEAPQDSGAGGMWITMTILPFIAEKMTVQVHSLGRTLSADKAGKCRGP